MMKRHLQLLCNQTMGHSVSTDNASRWIRYGLKTIEEMIPTVEEDDKKLDQGMVENFCKFVRFSKSEF